jgi:hypothetical protein
VVRSPHIHAHGQRDRVGKQTLKVIKMGCEVSKSQRDSNRFSISSDNHNFQKCPSEAFDGLNKQWRNGFLQWIENPQSILFHPLWRGPNGPMAIFLAIIVFLSILMVGTPPMII